jgi:phospholipid/cholesterol/gamma-HCH transport system substrate-binding protein
MKLRSERDTLAEYAPTLTRIAAAAGVIALGVAFLVVIFGSRATYEVHAVFEDVRGLIPGGEVKAGSDEVGTVEQIELGDDGLPVVTMSIDDDFRLRQGAFADIRLASNVGGVNRFVDLEQGDGPPISDGATLGPSQTDQPVDLDLAVSTLDPKARAETRALLAAVDASVRGRGDDLDRAVRHSAKALGETANVLAQVTVDRLALRTIVEQGRRVVGALASSPDSLGASAEQLATVLGTAGARQLELRRAVDALGPALGQARTTLDRLDAAIPNLTALAAAARPAAAEIVPTVREIRPAIDALRPLLREAGALVDAAPGQLRKLRPVLQAAAPALRYLDPLVDGFGPLLDYLRTWGPETVNFFALTADTTSNYDANGNLVRATAPALPTARHPNLIGPSDPGPGSLRRPFYRTPGSLEGEPWEDYADSFIGGGMSVETLFDGEVSP